jgi:hypothetical protein
MGSHYVYNIDPYIHIITCSCNLWIPLGAHFIYLNCNSILAWGWLYLAETCRCTKNWYLSLYDKIVVFIDWLIYCYVDITQRDGSYKNNNVINIVHLRATSSLQVTFIPTYCTGIYHYKTVKFLQPVSADTLIHLQGVPHRGHIWLRMFDIVHGKGKKCTLQSKLQCCRMQ